MDKKVKYLENLQAGIETDLNAYKKCYHEKKSFGVQNRLIFLMREYSSVAILKYLVEGDLESFFECCYNSALCFENNNIFCKCGMPHDRMSYSLIDSTGLFAGLLSVGRKKAGNLAWGIYPDNRYGEDEFIFCFTYGLLAFLIDGKEDSQRNYLNLLKEFRDEGRDADIEIGIYEGLLNKSKNTFVEAMTAYLKRREEQIKNKEDIQIGEESICIEALALIRLAQDLGIDVKINHRLTPLELQCDYPEIASFKREVPVVNDDEVDDAEFWEDWSPVGNVL